MAAYPGHPAGTAAGRRGGPAAARPAHRPGRAAPGGGRRRQDRGAAGVPAVADAASLPAPGCSAWPPARPPARGRRRRRAPASSRSPTARLLRPSCSPRRPCGARRRGLRRLAASSTRPGPSSPPPARSPRWPASCRPVRRVLDDWDFRLARDAAALRVRQGLLETRSQTVPLHRVQGVRVTWPLLWRSVGWARARIDVAGYARPRRGAIARRHPRARGRLRRHRRRRHRGSRAPSAD